MKYYTEFILDNIYYRKKSKFGKKFAKTIVYSFWFKDSFSKDQEQDFKHKITEDNNLHIIFKELHKYMKAKRLDLEVFDSAP